MPIHELRTLWRKYHGYIPPAHYQRGYLARRVGYHLQAMAYGGLDKTARQKLKRLAYQPEHKTIPTYGMQPGSQIIKEWRGQTITVQMQGESHFICNGKSYRSLSAIATELVGCKQSGVRFFGLHRKAAA